jgi:hypothetical protein
MRLIKRFKDWRLGAAGFVGAAIPLGMTLDMSATMTLVTDLLMAMLPIIFIFLLLGMMMKAISGMGRK